MYRVQCGYLLVAKGGFVSNFIHQLLMRRGPQTGEIFSLVNDETIIGRDPMSDISIDDIEVSRSHVRITRDEDVHFIQDLGSTNGTSINDERLQGEPVELKAGDIIHLGGHVTLWYQVSEEEVDALSVPVAATEVVSPPMTAVSDVIDLAQAEPNPSPTAPLGEPEEPELADQDDDMAKVVEPLPQKQAPAPPVGYKPMGSSAPPTDEQSDEWKKYLLIGGVVMIVMCACCFLLLMGLALAQGSGVLNF